MCINNVYYYKYSFKKNKKNSFLGIRLKRALESDIIWSKTNVFTSNAMIICSIVNILIAPFIQTEGDLLYYTWNVILLLPIILGCIYCYICKE
ncbi:MAG: SdpI family protein [Bacilli bacterium]